MTQPTDIAAIREALAKATPGDWGVLRKHWPMRMEGNFHQVTSPDRYPAAFVPAWDNPDTPELDGTEEALANALLIALLRNQAPAMLDEIEALRAERDRVRTEVAKLYCASGCDCCRDDDKWYSASRSLGEMLDAPRYPNNSDSFDWYAIRDAALSQGKPHD